MFRTLVSATSTVLPLPLHMSQMPTIRSGLFAIVMGIFVSTPMEQARWQLAGRNRTRPTKTLRVFQKREANPYLGKWGISRRRYLELEIGRPKRHGEYLQLWVYQRDIDPECQC